MSSAHALPSVQFSECDVLHGFRVRSVRPVPEIRALACEFEHERTGARFLHLYSTDPENLFSINFPTPPQDDTGLPHILEHAVLAGSERFPVREPFFEMIKMSMATFINAMTGWDCTYYPVCSNVHADLFNLAEVYFDAVFHPLLTEDIFRREGHHLAPADDHRPPRELRISGIVYNEMKSHFSQPEGRLFREAMRSLFPDTPYGRESGGDPEAIPELTYEQFLAFHHDHYNPTNARFLCYGDIPPERHLEFLDARLAGLDAGPTAPPIPLQPRWKTPQKRTETYAVDADEDMQNRTYLVSTWLVGTVREPVELFAHYLLGLLLFGNEGAPLKRALIDAKLGEDIIFSGFSVTGLESVFRVGLKGSEPERAEAFQTLVNTTLRELAKTGFPQRQIDAAFQQAAYDYREIGGHFPLQMLEQVLDAWTYGMDPLTYLNADEWLNSCREQSRENPDYFPALIRAALVDNPHRLDMVFSPSAEQQSEADKIVAEDLAKRLAAMSEEESRRLADDAARLEAQAGETNTPEQIATLPQLSLADLPLSPRQVPCDRSELPRQGTFLHNRVFSNGVNYLSIEFDIDDLPDDLWHRVPRLTETFGKLGAGDWNYREAALRKAEATGGIHYNLRLRTAADGTQRGVRGFVVSMKALDEQLERAMDVLETVLFQADPCDSERFSDVLVQSRARLRTGLVQDGLRTAHLRATRNLSPEAALNERLRGLTQLREVEKLVETFDETYPELVESVLRLRGFLLTAGRFHASFTGEQSKAQAVFDRLARWSESLPGCRDGGETAAFVPPALPRREGLTAPLQIAHCARAFCVPGLDSPEAPLLQLGTQLVNIDYMISEIRLKGNAYGAGCQYRSLPGQMLLFSYADPHLNRTYEVFDGLADYVKNAAWTRTELERAIISVAKGFQTPVRPDSATSETLEQTRTRYSPECRAEFYRRILTADVAEVRKTFLEVLENARGQSADCVVASRAKLEDANRTAPTPFALEPILSSPAGPPAKEAP